MAKRQKTKKRNNSSRREEMDLLQSSYESEKGDGADIDIEFEDGGTDVDNSYANIDTFLYGENPQSVLPVPCPEPAPGPSTEPAPNLELFVPIKIKKEPKEPSKESDAPTLVSCSKQCPENTVNSQSSLKVEREPSDNDDTIEADLNEITILYDGRKNIDDREKITDFSAAIKKEKLEDANESGPVDHSNTLKSSVSDSENKNVTDVALSSKQGSNMVAEKPSIPIEPVPSLALKIHDENSTISASLSIKQEATDDSNSSKSKLNADVLSSQNILKNTTASSTADKVTVSTPVEPDAALLATTSDKKPADIGNTVSTPALSQSSATSVKCETSTPIRIKQELVEDKKSGVEQAGNGLGVQTCSSNTLSVTDSSSTSLTMESSITSKPDEKPIEDMKCKITEEEKNNGRLRRGFRGRRGKNLKQVHDVESHQRETASSQGSGVMNSNEARDAILTLNQETAEIGLREQNACSSVSVKQERIDDFNFKKDPKNITTSNEVTEAKVIDTTGCHSSQGSSLPDSSLPETFTMPGKESKGTLDEDIKIPEQNTGILNQSTDKKCESNSGLPPNPIGSRSTSDQIEKNLKQVVVAVKTELNLSSPNTVASSAQLPSNSASSHVEPVIPIPTGIRIKQEKIDDFDDNTRKQGSVSDSKKDTITQLNTNKRENVSGDQESMQCDISGTSVPLENKKSLLKHECPSEQFSVADDNVHSNASAKVEKIALDSTNDAMLPPSGLITNGCPDESNAGNHETSNQDFHIGFENTQVPISPHEESLAILGKHWAEIKPLSESEDIFDPYWDTCDIDFSKQIIKPSVEELKFFLSLKFDLDSPDVTFHACNLLKTKFKLPKRPSCKIPNQDFPLPKEVLSSDENKEILKNGIETEQPINHTDQAIDQEHKPDIPSTETLRSIMDTISVSSFQHPLSYTSPNPLETPSEPNHNDFAASLNNLKHEDTSDVGIAEADTYSEQKNDSQDILSNEALKNILTATSSSSLANGNMEANKAAMCRNAVLNNVKDLVRMKKESMERAATINRSAIAHDNDVDGNASSDSNGVLDNDDHNYNSDDNTTTTPQSFPSRKRTDEVRNASVLQEDEAPKIKKTRYERIMERKEQESKLRAAEKSHELPRFTDPRLAQIKERLKISPKKAIPVIQAQPHDGGVNKKAKTSPKGTSHEQSTSTDALSCKRKTISEVVERQSAHKPNKTNKRDQDRIKRLRRTTHSDDEEINLKHDSRVPQGPSTAEKGMRFHSRGTFLTEDMPNVHKKPRPASTSKPDTETAFPSTSRTANIEDLHANIDLPRELQHNLDSTVVSPHYRHVNTFEYSHGYSNRTPVLSSQPTAVDQSSNVFRDPRLNRGLPSSPLPVPSPFPVSSSFPVPSPVPPPNLPSWSQQIHNRVTPGSIAHSTWEANVRPQLLSAVNNPYTYNPIAYNSQSHKGIGRATSFVPPLPPDPPPLPPLPAAFPETLNSTLFIPPENYSGHNHPILHQGNGAPPSKKTNNYRPSRKDVSLLPAFLKDSVGVKILSSTDVLIMMLTWNVEWLSEQYKCMDDPPPVYTTIKTVQRSFTAYKEYFNTYLPLLMIETWTRVFADWRQLMRKQHSGYNFFISEMKTAGDMIEISCTLTLKSDSLFPIEGYLVLLKFADHQDSIKIFGYINSHVFTTGINNSQAPFANESQQTLHLCIKVIYRLCDPLLKQQVNIIPVFNLKASLSQVEALRYVECSTLKKAIMSPEVPVCNVVRLELINSACPESLASGVEQIMEKLEPELPSSRIIVVDFHYGIDQQSILVALIEHVKSLNAFKDNSRILIYTRSINRLRELGARFIASRNSKTQEGLKTLILAKPSVANYPELRKLTLKERIAKHYNGDKLQTNTALFTCEKDGIKGEIVKSSDIILSLVTNCDEFNVFDLLTPANNAPITLCILDEAGMCTEPEALVPLRYGINKFILFNDNRAKVTLRTKIAAKYGYKLSFAERIMKRLTPIGKSPQP